MTQIKNIAIIGSGTMGNGIAHICALNGFNTYLCGHSHESLDAALKTIHKNLDRQVSKGTVSEEDKVNALNRLSFGIVLNEAISNADLIIEAINEDVASKLDLFKQIDAIAPANAIIASNTSSISITKLASATNRPDKVIGMHFMNPVPLMQLVEVINGYSTSSETTEVVLAVSKKLGKTPVPVQDYPGFVANKILLPMINEAIYTLHEGVGGVAEIDTIMKLGMAHPMGPLQLADFIGLDVCLSILKVMHDGFGNPKYAPCPLLVNMVEAGNLGAKTGKGFYIWSKESKDLVVADRFR